MRAPRLANPLARLLAYLGSAALLCHTAPAAVFIVNDPWAGHGNLNTLGIELAHTEGFDWPYAPTPYSLPLDAHGHLPDIDPWVGAHIDHVQPHPTEDGPAGNQYRQDVSVIGTSGAWVWESLSYILPYGSSVPLDPQITIRTSSGINLLFDLTALPPADNSDGDVAFLLKQSGAIVPETGSWTSSLAIVAVLVYAESRRKIAVGQSKASTPKS